MLTEQKQLENEGSYPYKTSSLFLHEGGSELTSGVGALIQEQSTDYQDHGIIARHNFTAYRT